MTATISSIITEEEYLQMEEKAVVRHEFVNGKLFEIPGGTMLHEQVIMNLAFLLKSMGLTTLAQGLRVRLPQTGNYYYPDVLVTAEKITKATFAETPILIAEVLSPSTRVYNLVDKFIAYRQFPSLYYYLIAEPDFCQVTLFYKTETGEWESALFRQLTDSIQLQKLGVQLPLSSIYDGVDWTDT